MAYNADKYKIIKYRYDMGTWCNDFWPYCDQDIKAKIKYFEKMIISTTKPKGN